MARVVAEIGGTKPSLDWEFKFGYPKRIVAGVDEVGRGCLAGPVVAAAAVLPDEVDFEAHPWLKKITDSKKLTAKTREELEPLLQAWLKAYGVGVGSVDEIDQMNIFHASHLAMERAVAKLDLKGIDHVLVDGKFLPKNLPAPATAIIKGDLNSLAIAAGSILAKVWRDRLMDRLEEDYPGYGFAKHKGYFTAQHREALEQQGASKVHRKSFAPVAQRLQAQLPL